MTLIAGKIVLLNFPRCVLSDFRFLFLTGVASLSSVNLFKLQEVEYNFVCRMEKKR